MAAAGLARGLLNVALEPLGYRLDRWRRAWFHPEREAGYFVEVLLIASFTVTFAGRYDLPAWVASVIFVVWALHLPADGWSWSRARLRPQGTKELHQRGFLLLDIGPLWLRGALGVLAAGVYLFIPPLRVALDFLMGFLFTSLRAWFS
jgi:hypothetical protein